jgi:hypothetical protein
MPGAGLKLAGVTREGRAVSKHPVAWGRNLVVPVALYFLAFVLLTFPAITAFSTAFFSDAGDGFQNVWNLWWVARAVRTGANPWFTHALHFPHGTSLVAHTLNPFNGFLGVALGTVLTPVQTYNTLFAFSFVFGGLTAFWLSQEVTGEYLGSLLCGSLFTFSAYHFAHAEGHLQLVALEWLPLFLLAWWRLLRRPSVALGMAAAGSLFLVLLCDYYYFFFCALAGAFLLVWNLVQHRGERPWRQRAPLQALGTFALGATVLCGPLLVALLRLAASDALAGEHDANAFSMDLLAPLLPGGHWRFAAWTRPYWRRLPGNIHESSVSWGLSAIALMGVAWNARASARAWFWRWSSLLAFFALLALGPTLHLAGRTPGHVPGPYRLLVLLVPPLKLAGVPVRMSVMTSLCVALIAGFGFATLWRQSGWPRGLATVLLAGAVVESWPRPLTLTPNTFPGFVGELRSLPKDGALFDVDETLGASRALYYQTLHEIPMVHGYISRVPESVSENDAELDTLAARGQWQSLCERYGVRYFVFDSRHVPDGPLGTARVLEGAADGPRVYDAARVWTCARDAGEGIPHPDPPLRWEPGAAPSQAETPGGICFISSINSRAAPGGLVRLRLSEPMTVSGWALERESHSTPEPVQVRLVRADGTSYQAAARRVVRRDMPQPFREAAYALAGLRLAGSVDALSPGVYRLTILQGEGAERKLCDSGIDVALQ